ncbi:MAG: membrane protein insertion efficiency factor YidD [Saprospiraceae bacterium]|nr:membrane protein insertion efficiency factor YidD [Saprospiraceae bacterium]MBK8450843.1 membrane protein insertion efficiency factor YidD [Saprospiraceae bacterium]MBK9720650.1 membrane protein insertion efficiency factor YidD [Saprospiraceae bacterium]
MKFLNYLIIGPVKAYQLLLSPILGKNCRFNPTCSNYMLQAVEEWGLIKGFYLGLKRITKCHPWGGCGEDPVPKKTKH